MSPQSATSLPPWLNSAYRDLCQRHEEGRLAHAYLLEGQRGLGKGMLARRFAAYLLCQESPQRRPCGECRSCRLLASGAHPDYREIAPEESGKQLRIDRFRDAIHFLSLTPSQGLNKVVVVEPAEAMNVSAANAFLKTLEEPSTGTVLLMICHRPGLLLPTVRSRCHGIKFSRPDFETARNWLAGQVADASADALLRLANGAPLRALDLARTDALDERRTLHELLLKLFSRRIGVVDAAAECANFNIEDTVEAWLLGLNEILTGLQTQTDARLSTPELVEVAGLLRGAGSAQALHAFHGEIIAARRALTSTANANRQLILESLLYKWNNIGMDETRQQG